MNHRTTAEVFEDHLALAQAGEVETDIARNFHPDVVLLTSYGVFHGHDGVRAAAALLEEQIGAAGYEYHSRLTHGEIAFLEWSASTRKARIDDGADTFLIHEGRVRMMTIHYTVKAH